MVSREVEGDLSAMKLGRKSFKKVQNSGSKFDRDGDAIGLPGGADEELRGIPVVIRVCEEHLGVDVLAKAVGTGEEFLRAGRELRL